jgi:N-acetylglucosamine-6-phosphate deacetylase
MSASPSGSIDGSVLAGARVVLPDRVQADGWVQLAGDRIVAVGSGRPPGGSTVRDLGGAWLLPGYIDLHMHGGGGHDVTVSRDEMRAAVAFHRTHGTTRTLVSLVTAPVDGLVEQLGWVSELTALGPGDDGHVIGSHLEGPFLSPVRCGAQNTDYMVAPDLAVLAELVRAGAGSLRCMTVAPELPGALEVVDELVRAGVVAALGHSDATYAQARAAIERGAALVTHLFNGMRPLHHREPGLVGAALESDIASELINDGIHTHPAIARLVAGSPDRLVLITDAIVAAGAGDGVFVLGGQPVQVQDRRASLVSTASLAGSTLTMAEAVRRAVLDGGLPIESASRAASANPARVVGIGDRVGSIIAGRDADLVVLDDDLRPTAVMAGGAWHLDGSVA